MKYVNELNWLIPQASGKIPGISACGNKANGSWSGGSFLVHNLQSAIIFFLLVISASGHVRAQESSLFKTQDPHRPMTLPEYSWTYQKPIEPHPIRLHDIVTVMIDEKSVVISEGQMDRKKKAYGDLKLPDWVLFKGFSLIPDPQTKGDPHVRGEVDNKMRSQANLETRDSIKFRIACNVVDIRPNGNLIIEGRRSIKNNNETWDYSLNGEIRAEDVLPNNTVLSENVANMRLLKREEGHVRDGYRRGWLLEWLDKYQPF
jgi:flagellar L-ring protein precursor FlgH